MSHFEAFEGAASPHRAAMDAVGLHQEAFRSRLQASLGKDKAALGLAVLDHLPMATIVLDGGGVALVNRAAEVLLALRDGLMRTPQPQGITTWKQKEALQLRSLIHLVLEEQRSGTVLVSRLRTPHPLLLSISPLPATMLNDGQRRVLITVRDLEPVRNAGQDEMLRSRYGLTQAESAVTLSLLGGRKPKCIARDRGVSVETVRSQIRQILTKTASASQCELMLKMSWAAGF